MKSKQIYSTLAIIIVTGFISSCDSTVEECHESIGQLSLGYLSSKRPYHFDQTQTHEYVPEGCTPVKFWYFGRHGTRNPGDDDIIAMKQVLPVVHEEILTTLEEGRGHLCPDAVTQFQSWKPRQDLNISEESFLVEQGRKELFSISLRYQERFPNLFENTIFDNSTYYFKYTDSERTKASAKSFAEAIFGPEGINQVWFPAPEKGDPVLKFYNACPKWTEEVDDNPSADKEHDLFVISSIMNTTISKVSHRAGLKRNLSLDEITIIYTTCAFETAWKNGTISPWCVLFDLDDFKVMSYREDLDYFWKDAYGHEINYHQACPPFRDAVNYFEKYIENPTTDSRKVQGYFSHSGANLKMLARLGLYKDSVFIKSDNFEQTKDDYSWRTSYIDFMGSNMAFTLYSCPSNASKYQIGYFTQEIPTPFSGCNGKAFCSFEDFRANLAQFVDVCNLEEICRI